MSFYPVLRFPLEQNLMPLLSYLQQQRIHCRVTEENGQQQLWINDEQRVVEVANFSTQWATGDVELPTAEAVKEPVATEKKSAVLARLVYFFPASLTVIGLGIMGALLVMIDLSYAEPFLFQPFVNGHFLPPSAGLEAGQYWRLITPIFLHFSFYHILFNGVILWAMGIRIERVKGSWHYLLLVIVVGLAANTAQYMAQHDTAFGGLSGVVFGVIGYIAVYQTFIHHPVLQFNRAIIAFFIVWLLLCFTGIVDWFIDGSVANAAHLAGLITGALFGAVVAALDRHAPNTTEPK